MNSIFCFNEFMALYYFFRSASFPTSNLYLVLNQDNNLKSQGLSPIRNLSFAFAFFLFSAESLHLFNVLSIRALFLKFHWIGEVEPFIRFNP